MKPIALALVAFLFFGCSDRPADEYRSAQTSGEMEDAGSDEWMVLFDGTSTDAFRGFKKDALPSSWVIEDGTLAYIPGGSDGGDIVTREQFGDFELELEWKISDAGNSGIIYRASEEFDAPWMTGPEYQILDNLKHPDARQGGDRLAGANYDVHPVDPAAVSAVGEWNSTRVVAHGPHVEHWLNGTQLVHYELYSDDWNARVADSKWVNHPEYGKRLEGHIALQDHGDRVWFRNIRIKRLGASD